MTITKNILPNSMVELKGEIDAVTFENYRAHVLEEFAKNLEVPGFRKGHLPVAMVSQHVSERAILEEMAEHALADAYPKIIDDEKIDVIGRPNIAITKLAGGNPLGFTITTAILPTITLPDYKKIAKEENTKLETPNVEEKEIDEAITELRRMRIKQNETTQKDSASETTEELPPIDEAFLASLGNFKDETELRAKIKENLLSEKTHRAKEKIRIATLERLVNETPVELPQLLIDGETENLIARIKSDITRMGLTFEGYLAHLKKTEEDFRKDLMPDAKKRAAIELITAEIAKKESLSPEEKEIEHETAHLLEHEPSADPIRARMYITHVLTNEKVWALLESFK